MPRYDGSPTNQEMRADFSANSHDAFVSLYERVLEGDKLDPSFEGKPISSLELTIYRPDANRKMPEIQTEKLAVFPLDAVNIEEMTNSYPFRDYPADVLERYRAIATNLGSTAINRMLRLRHELPLGAIESSYIGATEDKLIHVSNLFGRPTKKELSYASSFAEDALRYASADGLYDERIDGKLQHKLLYQITPDLPLNGYESPSFLIKFYKDMVERLSDAELELKVALKLGVSNDAIERHRHRIAMLERAVDRAISTITSKNL